VSSDAQTRDSAIHRDQGDPRWIHVGEHVVSTAAVISGQNYATCRDCHNPVKLPKPARLS